MLSTPNIQSSTPQLIRTPNEHTQKTNPCGDSSDSGGNAANATNAAATATALD
jgi:hypothetical protein